MKEPKVHVGILFEPQIEFILLNPYRINGMAFYENIYQHIRNGEVLQSDACGEVNEINTA